MARASSDLELIGDLIRRLRKEQGLTQQALATRADCSRSLIQQIENGNRIPQLSLRERLSLVLGIELPATGRLAPAAGSVESEYDELRMRFNVLLGKDAAAAERALRIAQSLVEATAVSAELEPLRVIADRQLVRAEELLAQVPSSSATVWEWNTISDWLTIAELATRSIKTIHVVTLGAIVSEIGDDYHDALYQLSARTGESRVDIRRILVLDDIEDAWPYEDRLWRLARAGIESVLIKREHARSASGLLLVDEKYVVVGEYDYSREARVATRFSALQHEATFALRRFEKLYDLKRVGAAISVNKLIAAPPFTRFERLSDGDCRAQFRSALEQAWAAITHV